MGTFLQPCEIWRYCQSDMLIHRLSLDQTKMDQEFISGSDQNVDQGGSGFIYGSDQNVDQDGSAFIYGSDGSGGSAQYCLDSAT